MKRQALSKNFTDMAKLSVVFGFFLGSGDLESFVVF
jgi:hypothetical protein